MEKVIGPFRQCCDRSFILSEPGLVDWLIDCLIDFFFKLLGKVNQSWHFDWFHNSEKKKKGVKSQSPAQWKAWSYKLNETSKWQRRQPIPFSKHSSVSSSVSDTLLINCLIVTSLHMCSGISMWFLPFPSSFYTEWPTLARWPIW